MPRAKKTTTARKPAAKKTIAAEKKASEAASSKQNKEIAVQKAATQAKVVKTLNPLARQINAHLASAEKADDKAVEHRVAAAIELADAKKRCTDAGVNFKSWCEENVKQSYETARKLAAAGATSDPAAAIADMRTRNKEANKALRDRKVSRDTTKAGKTQAALEDLTGKLPPRKQAKALAEAITALPSKNAETALADAAQALGFEVVNTEGKVWTVEELRMAFGTLKDRAKMEFLKWAADQVGSELVAK